MSADLVAQIANAELRPLERLRAVDSLPRAIRRRARERYETLRRTKDARESLDTIAGELKAGAFGRLSVSR